MQLTHEFTPRGAALAAMKSKAPRILLSGPAGTGKSRAALEKLHLMCLLNPDMKGLIVRKTARSLTTSALATFERDVIPEAIQDRSTRFYGGSERKPPAYLYSNGASISLGGMDNPDKVMSTEYDVIFVQEGTEIDVEDFEKLDTRLRNGRVSFQQMMIDCNPSHPQHFLLDKCNSGAMQMLESRHEDNPRYFNADGTKTAEGEIYIARLDALTGVRYLRLRLGQWAAAEGVIYADFDPAIHVIDPFDVPPDWDRVWSFDFGFTNPFCWQDWALDGDGRGYLVREIYHTERLVEDHATKIRDLCGLGPIERAGDRFVERPYAGPKRAAWERVLPSAIVCDHDAEDRATLERYLGMGTRPAEKAVTAGIQTVQARLKPLADGKPRMMFFRNALVEKDHSLDARKLPWNTVQEIPGYVWAAEPKIGDRRKEQPVKKNDHGCDTKRYFAMEAELHGATNVMWG